MKTVLKIFILLITNAYSLSHARGIDIAPDFSDYPVNMYAGHLKIPSYYKKIDQDWRDDTGKICSSTRN